MLIFPRKNWCPACLGGGCLPGECFFHRKGFFYCILISEGEEEKTISSQLGQSSEFIPGFAKYDACHILPYSAKKKMLTNLQPFDDRLLFAVPAGARAAARSLFFQFFSLVPSLWDDPTGKIRGFVYFSPFCAQCGIAVYIKPLGGSLGCGWMDVQRTGMAAWPISCHELLFFKIPQWNFALMRTLKK